MDKQDDFVSLILQHEGLLPGQTPFRVTSPAMRKWNTIHGFPINRSMRAPKGRENFLFLQNPGDVYPAVRQQFMNYMRRPSRYGLPANPTVMQAINVFDQTGARGKAKYLRSRGIDPNVALAQLFQEAA